MGWNRWHDIENVKKVKPRDTSKGGHIERGFRIRKWQDIFEPEKDSSNLKMENKVVLMYSVNMVGVQSKNKDN